jgi:hypothetical protein
MKSRLFITFLAKRGFCLISGRIFARFNPLIWDEAANLAVHSDP